MYKRIIVYYIKRIIPYYIMELYDEQFTTLNNNNNNNNNNNSNNNSTINNNNNKLFYIVVATKPHKVLDRIKEKVSQNGEQIIVLGESENRLIGWEGQQNFGVKLREVYNFIHNPELQPNDVVLFTDAYDVAYCGNKSEIVRRFFAFTKPIIFGCETQCNPDPNRADQYSGRNAEFPYLNSGMFIGRVWALRQCMSGYQYNDRDDDQRFWTTQYLTRTDLIELDYQNKIFLNTVDIDMTKFKWNSFGTWYRYNNPLFVHVNGPVKTLIDQLL